MGKKIDFFVLTAGITVFFYIYFRSAFDSPLICGALALLAGILLRSGIRRFAGRISNSRWMRKRQLCRCAKGALMSLACMDEAEASEKLSALIEATYGEAHETALLQRHPASELCAEDVFGLWRRRRGGERFVICATCRADYACRSLAAELKGPKVALMDADALSAMLAEHPEGMFPEEEKRIRGRLRLQHLGDIFFNRKNAPRCLLMSLSMLAVYVFSFNIFYLAAAMFLLFAALVSLRRRNRPVKLF